MMISERAINDMPKSSPGSPPDMTAYRSFKSSSLYSLNSDEHGFLADVSHFEEIGLGDEAQNDARPLSGQHHRTAPNPYYSPHCSSDIWMPPVKQAPNFTTRPQRDRDSSKTRQQHRGASMSKLARLRPSSLQSKMLNVTVQTAHLGLLPGPQTSPLPPRPQYHGNATRSSSTYSAARRRSPSPAVTLNPQDLSVVVKTRPSSRTANRERKTALELELECDQDDGDDIPEGLVLDNVPISPRPPLERAKSQPGSKNTSPDRATKERVRSVGNGTPAVAIAQGSLRSPSWRLDTALSALKSPSENSVSGGPASPILARSMGWNMALSELNAEAKALTEKLEEHAGEVAYRSQSSSMGSILMERCSYYSPKPGVKSALAELPSLRGTNIMIDPLPISREKEAVLSRTRPSWLPPKDPAEERRHLKEYQKIVMKSAEAQRRREAGRMMRRPPTV